METSAGGTTVVARDRLPARRRDLWRLAAVLLAALGALSYQSIGIRFYQGFRVPQGYGMNHLLPEELSHQALFFVFGLLTAAGLAVAIHETVITRGALAAFRGVARRERWLSLGVAAFIALAGLSITKYILAGGVLSDDEHTYRFIAQVLRDGSLTAPSPGTDLEFFREQFVVLNETVRYGKYPIGHPLLVAIGQVLGGERWVVPIVTGLLALATVAVGGAAFGAETAALALLLLASSPQVLVTGSSLLSQPASALCVTAAVALLVWAGRAQRRRPFWLALAGAALGYGVLVRPLPGLLFALVFVTNSLFSFGSVWRPRDWAALLVPLSLLAGVVPAVNHAQSGSMLVSGYQAFHVPEATPVAGLLALTHGDVATSALSLAGTTMRLNFWLFGWPISFVFCAFAGRSPAVRLLWMIVGAEVAYRLLVPKVGVSGAGPVYAFEAVPALCLLSAHGIVRLGQGRVTMAGLRPSAHGLAAVVLAGLTVNVLMFLPAKLGDLYKTGAAQQTVFRIVRGRGISHALVFHEGLVPPWTGLSWAHMPRCNSPALNDDLLFVNFQSETGRLDENLAFWKRRYPDRQAWFYAWDQVRGPILVPLIGRLAGYRSPVPLSADRGPTASDVPSTPR